MDKVVLANPLRTAIGDFGGSLKAISAAAIGKVDYRSGTPETG